MGAERLLYVLALVAIGLAVLMTGLQQGFAIGWFTCSVAVLAMAAREDRWPPCA